jgi:lactate dehydrogenase-like 2-hydroxyacid dehydrogenase
MASLLGASQAEEPHENPDPKVICVLGAGSFGTAMAFVAARRGNKVRIYARNQEQVKLILLIPLFTSVFFFFFQYLMRGGFKSIFMHRFEKVHCLHY